MQDENNSASVVEYVPEEVSFLKGGVDLKKLLRGLHKHQQAAIDALVKIITTSKDEQNVLRAASKLLELNIAVAKEINDDQLKRLVAEIKMNQASKNLVPLDADDNRPLVDFNEIRQV